MQQYLPKLNLVLINDFFNKKLMFVFVYKTKRKNLTTQVSLDIITLSNKQVVNLTKKKY